VGGRLLDLRGAGVVENRKLEARGDVLTFTTPVFTRDIDFIGRPQIELSLSVDNPHADIFVRLCDVDRRGRSKNFSDAFVRLDHSVPAGKMQQVVVQLDPCAHRLLSNHRLRLQLSGGAHPRFARNVGTEEPLATARNLMPSEHQINHAGSRVILPFSAS
jgi:putative CocE/NonD family hydrolase